MLTRTGLGTLVENGKRTIEIDGETWLLEKPLRADFALIKARQADQLGNLTYELTAQNFNPVMAMAGRTVIAEADEIVPVGASRPTLSGLPASWSTTSWSGSHDPQRPRDHRAARRPRGAARRSVNLGIGLPTQVAAHLPRGITVFFQTENGLAGVGPRPAKGMENPNLVDAGGGFITAIPGAASFDSTFSFGLIRGGHLDLTVLGGLQVDAKGRLANWMIPGKLVPGMGGAMDLVSGAARHRRHDP